MATLVGPLDYTGESLGQEISTYNSGSGWIKYDNYFGWKIHSNTSTARNYVNPTSDAGIRANVWDQALVDFPDDQWIEADFSGIPGGMSGSIRVGIALHLPPAQDVAAPSPVAYFLSTDGDDSTIHLKDVFDSFSGFSTSGLSFSSTRTLRLEQNGTVLTSYVDGVLQDTRDRGASIQTGGQPGLLSTASTSALMDDIKVGAIRMGDFVSGGSGAGKLRRTLVDTSLTRAGLLGPFELPNTPSDFHS